MTIKFSVIIPSCEEENTTNLGKIISKEHIKGFSLEKIIVVESNFARKFDFDNPKIMVIKEKTRKGKAAAINAALKKIKSEIIIVESSDTIPKKRTFEKLLKPFRDEEVGVTTGRAIPLNSKKNFLGFLTHIIWFLHHLISLEKTKCGEIIAFRSDLRKIPSKVATDESYVESFFYKKNYKIVYVSSAIVNNYGIENLSYIIGQRKRYFVGHLHIKKEYGYSVSTLSLKRIFKALFKYFRVESIRNYKEIAWIFGALFIEAFARILAGIEFYLLRKTPYKWEIVRVRKP